MIHDKVLHSAVRHNYEFWKFQLIGKLLDWHITTHHEYQPHIWGKYLHEILIDICMIVKWNLTKAFYYKPLV